MLKILILSINNIAPVHYSLPDMVLTIADEKKTHVRDRSKILKE